MKVYAEKNLTNFEFWAGAKANAERLTYEEIERIGEVIEKLYPEGIDKITVNNCFGLNLKARWNG